MSETKAAEALEDMTVTATAEVQTAVLSLKTLDKRMQSVEERVRSVQHSMLYLMEYCLFNEGRDRHYGPKPNERIREIRRLADTTRKEIANGFTTDHRPDTVKPD